MLNVVEIDTRKLRVTDFCVAERSGDGSWSTEIEAWTVHPLDEVLREEHRAKFLSPITRFAKPGDRIEIFRVADLEKPDRDPLEMRHLTVTHFDTDRHGPKMQTFLHPNVLYFGAVTAKGVEERTWRGKHCVFKDGKRMGSFLNLTEAVETAERLRDPSEATFAKRVDARLAELRKPVAVSVSLPSSHRCRREDIGYGPPKRISRTLIMRVLNPIGDVLADPTYFSRVGSCFKVADRLTILRFDNDTYAHALVEMLPLAVVDMTANRVRLIPHGDVLRTGREPESGWVRETIKGRVHLRKDGRTVETFASPMHCDWHCADKGITTTEFKQAA